MAKLCAAAVLLSGLMSGCVAGDDAASGSAYTGSVPDFTGPWATEFAATYENSSDTVRSILEDGVVSDAEYAEVTSDFLACMRDRGIPVRLDDQYGAFTLPDQPAPDATSDAALDACASDFDDLSALRLQTARNPEHLDDDELIVSCLVAAGLVDPDYTAAQLSSDSDDLPFDVDDPEALACFRDPLGLLE